VENKLFNLLQEARSFIPYFKKTRVYSFSGVQYPLKHFLRLKYGLYLGFSNKMPFREVI